MCLIITIIMAVISTALWFFKYRDSKYNLLSLVLMYWGASIMWSVDGIFCVLEGEPFFDISMNDTMLGILIAVCGLIAYGFIRLVNKSRA